MMLLSLRQFLRMIYTGVVQISVRFADKMQLEENYEKTILAAFAYPTAIPKSAWLIVYYNCLRITRVVANKYSGLNTFAAAFRDAHTYSTAHGNRYNFTDKHRCAYSDLNPDAYPPSQVHRCPTTSEDL